MAVGKNQLEHPQPDQLAKFGLGTLSGDTAAEVERHVKSCDTCCQALDTLQNDDFVQLLRATRTDANSQASSPPSDLDDVNQATVRCSMTDLSAEGSADMPPDDDGKTEFLASIAPIQVEDLPPGLVSHARYRVLELAGVGGMGAVYKARHKLMERTVALKVINSRLTGDADAVARFQREVKAAASLSHPNIVTAYDAEQVDNLHLLVMEYVEGTSLADEIRQHARIPVSKACDYVFQAALGLQHAEDCGMVHRDIKPQNLMLTADGRVKILDFGLACLVSESTSRSGLTEVGTVMGTVDYMAPEQANDAHSADIRADIYSLGCTFHALLTGQVPFPEGSLIQKLKAHADRPMPSVRDLRDDVPHSLALVVQRMTAKNPADRYQMPSEVAEALAPFAGQSGAAGACSTIESQADAKPVRQSGKRRILTLVAAMALLLFGSVIYIATDKGTFEIKSEFDDVEIIVSKGGEDFTVIDLATDSKVQRLPSGDYKVSLRGRSDLELNKHGFTLKRWGTEAVTVTLKPEGLASDKPARLQPIAEGTNWRPLFNGKDLSGWTAQGRPDLWRVENSLLVGEGNVGTYLATERDDFTDFHLRATVRLNAKGNSGLFFRANFDPAPAGYEAQMTTDTVQGIQTGGLFMLAAENGRSKMLSGQRPLVNVSIRPGEWFTLEVIALGNRLVTRVNGNTTLDYVDAKYVHDKGRLAIQLFGPDKTKVEFKSIEVGTLPETAQPKSPYPSGSAAFALLSDEYEWTEPENLGPKVNSDAGEGYPFVSADGLTLLLESTRDGGEGGCDIWQCTRSSVDDPWSEPVNLGAPVNSVALEAAPQMSADARTLVFISTRDSGLGAMDLWRSTRKSVKDAWGKPVNLGADINSHANDNFPFLSPDGLRLIFNTNRSGPHLPWITERGSDADPWSKPRPYTEVGRRSGRFQLLDFGSALLNTPFKSRSHVAHWDVATRQWEFSGNVPPFPDGEFGDWPCYCAATNTLYFQSDRPGGLGQLDLWMSRRVKKQSTTEQKKQAALVAAQEWLKLVDAGKYAESWETSAKINRDTVAKQKMVDVYNELFKPLGPLKSRVLKSNEFKTQMPRAPVGEYAVIQFGTQFTNQRVIETVVLMREPDGQWRVSGYFHAEDSGAAAPLPDGPVLLKRLQPTDGLVTKEGVTQEDGGWKIESGGSREVILLEVVNPGIRNRFLFAVATLDLMHDELTTETTLFVRVIYPSNSPAPSFSRKPLTRESDWTTHKVRATMARNPDFVKIQVGVAFKGMETIRVRNISLQHEPIRSVQNLPQGRTGILTNPPFVPPGGLPIGKNLIVDASLEDTQTGALPQSWSAWLDDGPNFKCEVVEGGVTGKHCLQISGTGTRGVVFATSIPLDRTKRYALKGRVKVEGEAGTWAVVKLNYFNNTGWLGVDYRVGVTTSDLDWKLFEKTDLSDKYATATLIVPTCHIEGNGTAWFDDLEVVAYDRGKLPDNFEATLGKNNRMK